MPLPYEVTTALDIPASKFNADAIAVVSVQGGRYGGDWIIHVWSGAGNEPVGEIETTYDLRHNDLTKDARYPDLAVDTAFVWLHDEVKKRGWRLLSWDNLNDNYGPDERPFFMMARAAIGSEKFVPAPGVKYADEIPA